MLLLDPLSVPVNDRSPSCQEGEISSKLTVLRGEGGCPSWVKFVGKHPRHHFPSRYLGQPRVNLPISLWERQWDRAACTHKRERLPVMIIYAPVDCSFGWREATPTSISVCCRRAALREIGVEIEILFVCVCVCLPNASIEVLKLGEYKLILSCL